MSAILDAKDGQFRLAENGTISFQPLETNPLPGELIAKLEKGETALTPNIALSNPARDDAAALVTRLEAWRDAYIASGLELLVELKAPLKEPEVKDGQDAPAPLPPISEAVQKILDAVYDALGILPREGLEPLIAQLTPDDRRVLRAKRVRLGPILVFIPALNKPASVRLRAMLWSVYHGHALPAQVPNDGMVSCVVDSAAVDKDFYQAIGYPVFANRAVRIDMLDRVICAVYDSADKGKFRAQHQMAEWLGSSIDDLYGVLEAMGHKRIIVEDVPVVAPEETPVVETPAAESAAESTEPDASIDVAADVAAKIAEVAKPTAAAAPKPELAEFFLKRGKAFEKRNSGGGFKSANKSGDQSKSGYKKRDDKKRDDKKQKGKRNQSATRQPRIMSADAKKVEDSPFAILEQLKK